MARTLQVNHARAHNSFRIDAPVAVEILVFSRDEGMLDQVRNFVRRKIKPPLARIFGKQAAVRRMHARHDRRLIVLEQRVIREVLLVLPYDAGEHRRRHDEQQSAGRKYEADNPSDTAHLSIEAFHCARRRAPQRRDEPKSQRLEGADSMRPFCRRSSRRCDPSRNRMRQHHPVGLEYGESMIEAFRARRAISPARQLRASLNAPMGRRSARRMTQGHFRLGGSPAFRPRRRMRRWF